MESGKCSVYSVECGVEWSVKFKVESVTCRGWSVE